MAQLHAHLSTGLPGLDRALCGLIPGDNIVWQVSSFENYLPFVEPFYKKALSNGRQFIYFRFGDHAPLLSDQTGIEIYKLNPQEGFETFIANIHRVIEKTERGAWYLFDCLSGLAEAWYSDTMFSNFFKLTCPYLYDVQAIAYFSLLRNFHATESVKLIMDTTQIFIDVHQHKKKFYVQPIKVQQRYSSTMYMLHEWHENQFTPLSDSSTTAEILSTTQSFPLEYERLSQGIWHKTFRQAEEILMDQQKGKDRTKEAQEIFQRLLHMAITHDERMLKMIEKYLTLKDIVSIARRIIGTGLIGGKAIGMLLARAILKKKASRWTELLETHDSFYIGSNVFYTYLLENGLWWKWQRHRNPDNFLYEAEQARQRILVGIFPDPIKAQFQKMLDYYGQSPIIVRSSSLLEDSFGHAFAGKYESIFLANQGSREFRLQDFISAVQTIYASTMSAEALIYRARHQMLEHDEQMAILVQRVSGAVHDHLFFPHMAGVGFSYNPYVWSKEIDPKAGVLRLVFGLGTRAVDRIDNDYTRLVALNAPERSPFSNPEEARAYVQRKVDIIDLQANQLISEDFEEVIRKSPDIPVQIFASRNTAMTESSKGKGNDHKPPSPWLLRFENLLQKTDYVSVMSQLLQTLQKAYKSPVDIEFTTNFFEDQLYKINLVQCRPLQVKGENVITDPPAKIDPKDLVLEACGAIIGQSRVCDIDRIIYIVPSVYGHLTLSDRYSLARLIGKLVHLKEKQKPKTIMLIGPGRWGTSTPQLGIPVTFSEISKVSIISEIVIMNENIVPDVSLGTHFFSEMVEADILYFALFPHRTKNYLHSSLLEGHPNQLSQLMPDSSQWAHAIRVIDTHTIQNNKTLIMNANTLSQRVLCYFKK